MISIPTNYYGLESIEIQSILREKGQLTLPFDVRTILNLREGDRVAFIINEQKKVEVVKKPSVVAQTAGILKTTKPVPSAEELRMTAERSIAEAAIKRGNK